MTYLVNRFTRKLRFLTWVRPHSRVHLLAVVLRHSDDQVLLQATVDKLLKYLYYTTFL